MGNWVMTLAFALLVAGLHAQTNPRFFPKQVNPDSSNFESYSQKNGQNYKANLWDLKRYYTPKYPGLVAYVPAPTGNVLNRTEFVKGADGVIYYIDATGKSVKFDGGVTPGALSDSIAYVLELVSDWDTSATNELQVIYIVNHRLYISGSTDPGLNLSPYRDSIYIVSGGGRDTLKTSTGYKALLPLADGSETKINVAGLLAISGSGTTGTPYNVSTPGGTLSGTGGTGFVGFPVQSSAPGTPGIGFRLFADASGRFAWKGSNGYVRVFDGVANTADRIYTLPDVNGAFVMREGDETLTGIKTFAPTGSGGAGFIYSSTNRPSHPLGNVTTAQMNALTGMGAGDLVYNATTKRINLWDLSWLGVPTMASGGISANYIVYGNANGDLTSSPTYQISGNGIRFSNSLTNALTLTSSDGSSQPSIIWYKENSLQATMSVFYPGSGAITFLNVNSSFRSGQRLNAAQGLNINSLTNNTVVDIVPSYTNLGDLSGGGYGLRLNTGTYTNNSTPTSGTVANASLASLDGGVVAATNTGVVYTNLSTLRIAAAPTSGTNVTISNPWALRVESGATLLNGNVTFGNGYVFDATPRIFSPGTITLQGNNTSGYNVTIDKGQIGLKSANGGILVVDGGNTQLAVTSGTMDLARISGRFSAAGASTTNFTALNVITTYDHNGSFTGLSRGILYTSGHTGVGEHRGIEIQSGNSVFNNVNGSMIVGGSTPTASALVEMVSTAKGLLIPRATSAQIAAVSSPALALQMFSTTTERINIKLTGGFFQLAYVQDVKRDTSYKVVNSNLNLSGETTNFKNRYHTVRVSTTVTAVATGNNTITMPVPSVDLLGINFKFIVGDTSGDSDISVISFGTDGVDGYLSNGDATYQSSQNLFPGLGVYVSVGWDENKGAYRWFLQ